MMTVLLIVFGWLTLIVVIILHYITRWKGKRGVTSEEEKILTHLWDVAERIETRLANVERIHNVDHR